MSDMSPLAQWGIPPENPSPAHPLELRSCGVDPLLTLLIPQARQEAEYMQAKVTKEKNPGGKESLMYQRTRYWG